MELNIIDQDFGPDLERAYTLSMVIKSFKGRRDVEVHLFRFEWDDAEMEEVKWDSMIGPPMDPSLPNDPESSKKLLMEAFTAAERDNLVAYLQEQYDDRLVSISSYPLDLPIPAGLTPLSEIPEGKDIGLLRFEKIPSYKLDIKLHGIFDLSQHEPIVRDQD